MGRTRVKMCGITRREDAIAAVAAGADALGFVFYPGSSRYVTPEVAAMIVAGLPPFLTRVGLFVNASHAEILQTVALNFLDAIQLHGDETPAFCQQLSLEMGKGIQVIKALRIATQQDLHEVRPYCGTQQDKNNSYHPTATQEAMRPVQALLLDAKVGTRYGGTGQSFDWSLLGKWHSSTVPLILAGGLHADNVATAIHQTQPYAVDVSSGLETTPGQKSVEKMTRFMREVQQADRSVQ